MDKLPEYVFIPTTMACTSSEACVINAVKKNMYYWNLEKSTCTERGREGLGLGEKEGGDVQNTIAQLFILRE